MPASEFESIPPKESICRGLNILSVQPVRTHLRFIVPLLFVLSGFTSLVYEITWSRMLATIIGNTSLAISIVVSIFMAGLALGSFFAARSNLFGMNPLRAYGLLEALIGIYAAATPWTSHLVEALYSNAYSLTASSFLISVGIKAVLAALFLLLPAVAMGASLPILIRIYDPEERRIRASLLYAINTTGAVAGTLFAGYGLLPLLGAGKTIWLTAVLNGAIGVIAFLATTESRLSSETQTPPARLHPAYWLSLLTGLTILSYEILWTRALSMFFGSSVYAFSTILAAFLVGIASGSRFYAKRIPPEADPFQFFSLIQFRIALSAILFLGIFMGLPLFLIALFETFYFSFPLFQLAQFLLIGCAVFYTTFLSGGAFPAALHFFRGKNDEVQTHAGYVYSFNTVGSIAGSLLAGFFLIPYFGVERSIRLILIVNLLIGLYCYFRSVKRDNKLLAIAAASLIFLFVLPRWNRSIYNGGFYAFAYKYVPASNDRSERQDIPVEVRSASLFPSKLVVPGLSDSESRKQPKDPDSELNLIYYGEGLTATVAVAEHAGGVRSLLINGKPEASNVPTGDMRTQLLLGHLPLFVRSGARDALVIGLGSGVTAGALSLHNLSRIDCVEIEKKVAEAARYYDRWNFGIFEKPNFRLILDDGRNFVQHAPTQYDIITSEPSNLWMSGVANLFTREFFQAAKKKLRPGGVMCQWIHLYQISLRDIYVFLRTYQSVFPHLSIWIDGSDMLIIGSNEALNPSVVQSNLLLSNRAVRESLERSALTASGISALYTGDEGIIRLLPAGIPLNTDDHPILEFSAPRSQFKNDSEFIASRIALLQKRSALNKAAVK